MSKGLLSQGLMSNKKLSGVMSSKTGISRDSLIVEFLCEVVNGNVLLNSGTSGVNATIQNQMVYTTGKIGQCVSKSWAKIEPWVMPSNYLTLSFWFYEDQNDSYLISLGYKQTGRPLLGFYVQGGEGKFQSVYSITSSYDSTDTYIPLVTFTSTSWHHVVFTYDKINNWSEMWFDGVRKYVANNTPAAIPASPTHSGLCIGGSSGWSYNMESYGMPSNPYGQAWMKGKLDLIRIYSRLLSQDEILSLYGEV